MGSCASTRESENEESDNQARDTPRAATESNEGALWTEIDGSDIFDHLPTRVSSSEPMIYSTILSDLTSKFEQEVGSSINVCK